MIACQGGHFDIVELLLDDQRIDCNKGNDHTSPLMLSMNSDDQRVFRHLLESERINHEQKTDKKLVYVACANGCLANLQIL